MGTSNRFSPQEVERGVGEAGEVVGGGVADDGFLPGPTKPAMRELREDQVRLANHYVLAWDETRRARSRLW